MHAAGGSFADSRMANLQGHFALLARVDGAPAALDAIGARLVADAKGHGLDVKLHRVEGVAARAGTVPYRLKTYSPDQHGIVARVAALLAEHAVNVEELETRLETAPFAGTPLFTIHAVNMRLRNAVHHAGNTATRDLRFAPMYARLRTSGANQPPATTT